MIPGLKVTDSGTHGLKRRALKVFANGANKNVKRFERSVKQQSLFLRPPTLVINNDKENLGFTLTPFYYENYKFHPMNSSAGLKKILVKSHQ